MDPRRSQNVDPEITGPNRDDGACADRIARAAELRLDRVQRLVRPTDEQRAAFDELRAASLKAMQTLRAACSGERPLTPPARMAAAEKWLDARLQAMRILRPALDSFYKALSDEQKMRWITGGRDDRFGSRDDRFGDRDDWRFGGRDDWRFGGRQFRREWREPDWRGGDDGWAEGPGRRWRERDTDERWGGDFRRPRWRERPDDWRERWHDWHDRFGLNRDREGYRERWRNRWDDDRGWNESPRRWRDEDRGSRSDERGRDEPSQPTAPNEERL